jgi:hypothetical protein
MVSTIARRSGWGVAKQTRPTALPGVGSRQENQAKPVEGRSQAACGRHQAQGDEAAGDRGEEHVRPAGRLGDRCGPSALEHEVLGGHEGDRRGARVGLVSAARVAHGRGDPSSSELAATPAGTRPLRDRPRLSSSPICARSGSAAGSVSPALGGHVRRVGAPPTPSPAGPGPDSGERGRRGRARAQR